MYMWGMIEKELVAASTEPLILSLLAKKRNGQQALKDKREQWKMISSVLGGLWKGQYV